jgi:hypothetical protein
VKKQLAVYQFKVTIRSDESGAKPLLVKDIEVVVEQAVRSVVLKQAGGLDHALVEVTAEAERVDE